MYNFLKTLLVFSFALLGCKANNSAADKKPVIVRLPDRISAISTSEKTTVNGFTYDLKKPDHSWKLPEGLQEVSGNTWVDKDHLILIEDLDPLLYLIKFDDKNATIEKKIEFQKNGKGKFDIEDVTINDGVVYALWSHGILFKISDWNSNHPSVEKWPTSLSKDNNTEGVCYDPVTNNLLIACKDDSGIPGEKKSTKAVYQFSMQSKMLFRKPFLVIHKDDFEKLAGDKLHFNPSAIAVHPVTHDIYLLSTKDNKCMAIYDRNGKLIGFQKIDDDMMPQPEGICFSPDGKLFISSEGKKHENGRLFEFDPK